MSGKPKVYSSLRRQLSTVIAPRRLSSSRPPTEAFNRSASLTLRTAGVTVIEITSVVAPQLSRFDGFAGHIIRARHEFGAEVNPDSSPVILTLIEPSGISNLRQQSLLTRENRALLQCTQRRNAVQF